MIKLICLLFASFIFNVGGLEIKESKESFFLLYKTTIRSTKDIGGKAQTHIPALFKEAKTSKLKVLGQIHHFYYNNEKGSFLEIALPVENLIGYKGKYPIVRKTPYKYAALTHSGPVSKIGESWAKLHTQVAAGGQIQGGSIEIYTSGTKSLLKNETTIELRQIVLDKSQFKECFISGTAPGSQAQKAGIKSGDVIISYGGTLIKNSGDLILAIKSKEQDQQKIELIAKRRNKQMTFKVSPGKLGVGLMNR